MFDHRAKFALLLTAIMLTLGGLGLRAGAHWFKLYLHKEPVELRESLDTISNTLGKWKSVRSDKFSEDVVETLGTRQYIDRHYIREGGEEGTGGTDVMLLHIAYYTGLIDTVPHVPDRCMLAAGYQIRSLPKNLPLDLASARWFDDPEFVNLKTNERYQMAVALDPIYGRPITVRMPIGDLALRTVEFAHTEMPDASIYGGYFFIANGRIAVSPEDVKRFAFDRSERYAYYCKVQFVTRMDRGTDRGANRGADGRTGREDFLEQVTDMLEPLLPELMRCLPNWAEVERRDEVTDQQVTESTG